MSETQVIPFQQEGDTGRERACHLGGASTPLGVGICGAVFEPRPHSHEECNSQGHEQCVVCWEMYRREGGK